MKNLRGVADVFGDRKADGFQPLAKVATIVSNVVPLPEMEVPVLGRRDGGILIGRVPSLDQRDGGHEHPPRLEHPEQLPQGSAVIDVFKHMVGYDHVGDLVFQIERLQVQDHVRAPRPQVGGIDLGA